MRSCNTTNRYIYRGNRYTESIHSTRLFGGEGDILDTKLYIRNKGPLKGYCTKVYKPRNPLPTGYKEGIKNTEATIIINKELVLHRESDAKAIEDKRPPTQIEINYIHYKMGRHRVEIILEKGCKSAKSNYIEHPIVKGDSPPI